MRWRSRLHSRRLWKGEEKCCLVTGCGVVRRSHVRPECDSWFRPSIPDVSELTFSSQLSCRSRNSSRCWYASCSRPRRVRGRCWSWRGMRSRRRWLRWSHRSAAERTCLPLTRSSRTATSVGVTFGDAGDGCCDRRRGRFGGVAGCGLDWISRRRGFPRRILGRPRRDHGTRTGIHRRWSRSRTDRACVFVAVNCCGDFRNRRRCVPAVRLCRIDRKFDAFSLQTNKRNGALAFLARTDEDLFRSKRQKSHHRRKSSKVISSNEETVSGNKGN